jgi:hypothetical protein
MLGSSRHASESTGLCRILCVVLAISAVIGLPSSFGQSVSPNDPRSGMAMPSNPNIIR